MKDVVIKEAPNGVAGEIAIQVAYTDQSTEPRQKVAAAIEELRPAGIRVIGGEAATLKVNVECDLTLTGSSLSGLELNSLTTALEDSLFAYLSKVPPGAPVRRAKLVQLAMSDDRVEDAKVLLTPQGQEPVEELTLDSGVALDVQRPFNFPPPAFVQAAAAAATTATVTATLPIHLAPEITLTQASDAIRSLSTVFWLRGVRILRSRWMLLQRPYATIPALPWSAPT